MKTTRKLIIILIISLTGLLAIQLYMRNRHDTDTQANNLVSGDFEDEDFHDLRFNNFMLDSNTVATTYNSIKIPLESIDPSNTLFVRYSVSGCAQCIDNLLNELNALKGTNDSIQIIMLLQNIGSRDLYVNWVAHDKKFQMLHLDYIPLDTIATPDSPYLFRITNDGHLRDHFICQYGDKSNLNKYLNSL